MENQRDKIFLLNENTDLKIKIIFMTNQISSLKKKIKILSNPYKI